MKNHLPNYRIFTNIMKLIYQLIVLPLLIDSLHSRAEELTERYGDKVGTVNFPVSGNLKAAELMERGVALLHHMTYDEADKIFQSAIEADPNCAMAYWGRAMTILQPLWPSEPDDTMLDRGWSLLRKARSQGIHTNRERYYIEALEAYFRDGKLKSEKERLVAFAEGWKRVYEQFPEDLEAAAFYALAHMSTASTEDKTYQVQREAGAIAETIWAQIPAHPGAHHYIIHAYDYPSLAEEALPAARNYGKVAPYVPHALHMPTHIFTRRGLWEESIHWNLKSADAAWLCGINEGGIATSYLHALDYLVYAYLQTAQDKKASEIAQRVRGLPYRQINSFIASSAYAFSAIPARVAIERQDWESAANLTSRQPASFPWDNGYPHFEAVTHFAKALGYARTGDTENTQVELLILEKLRNEAADYNEYWEKQVEIQRLSAMAWFEYQSGQIDKGFKSMREAAQLEASTYKHPVTPGEVLPASELLADMLINNGDFSEAQEAYQKALSRTPNRLNSLYGAGRAAELAGDFSKATTYFKHLVRITENADTISDRLAHARSFLRTRSR